MRFFLTALILNLKRIVKTGGFIFMMTLLPVFIIAAAYYLQKDSPIINIRVGIVFNENDSYSNMIYENIVKSKGILFEQFSCDEQGLAKFEELIKTGELECGYIIKEDISAKIEKGKLDNIIKLVKSPKTIADAIINEMVYASVIKTALTHITANEIVRAFKMDSEKVTKAIEEKVISYYELGNDEFVKPDYYYEDGLIKENNSNISHINKRILHGIISLFILTATAFMIPRFIDEKKSGIVKKLGRGNIYVYYFSLFSSFFICNFFYGLVSIFSVKALYPLGLIGIWSEIYCFALYNAAVCMLGLFVISILRKSDVIYSSFIFILIITFCLGGIVFDLKEISEPLGGISNFFVTSNYINLILYGENKYFAVLFLFFIVSLFITLAVLRIKHAGD